ncbi:unnamed protein product [Caenorhabditis auriculariae]|uniref:Large ribosomal subunit protein uL4 C-terminal domain-containing protein n=1 Tax=Caenorhabditis auriculariae TaxID=2777116 RepID=A0A8S1I0C4_9PELO|nr:unnamed protein product [Caenorhabditis auriculariae]
MAARPLVTVYDEKYEATQAQIKLPAFSRTNDKLTLSRLKQVCNTPRSLGVLVALWLVFHVFVAAVLTALVWRRWHRRVNIAQKRYAVTSAIAASGVPALVQARGHVIDKVAEVPFVVSDKVESFRKTKEAVTFLRRSHLWEDIEKVYNSKRTRAGKGKMRNRQHKQKLGPLVIYGQDAECARAFRNIPGVDVLNVERLNILKLAPGGHLGRLIIWTESAFNKLDAIYGTQVANSSELKKGWSVPLAKMQNADFARIIRSEEVVKAIRAPKKNLVSAKVHRNPLKKRQLLHKLNPYATALRQAARKAGKA